MVRAGLVVGAFVVLAIGTGISPAAAAEPEGAIPAPVPAAPPPPSTSAPAPAGAPEPYPTSESAGVPMVAASDQAASAAKYGIGLRGRVISIPRWMLGLFLDESVPLTSYSAGAEVFRRTGNFDLVLGVAYQNLSPKDGNWLGAGNDRSTDVDFIQFRNLGSWSFDAAFILHTDFNEYIGMHYGGGIGVGIVTGKMLRTSNGSDGCATDPGSVVNCHPIVCTTGPCTEAQLRLTEGGGNEGPGNPVRFADNHIPAIYPIVNLITGLDVRLPTVPGFAIKLDVGYFFPYFFGGLSAAYQI